MISKTNFLSCSGSFHILFWPDIIRYNCIFCKLSCYNLDQILKPSGLLLNWNCVFKISQISQSAFLAYKIHPEQVGTLRQTIRANTTNSYVQIEIGLHRIQNDTVMVKRIATFKIMADKQLVFEPQSYNNTLKI